MSQFNGFARELGVMVKTTSNSDALRQLHAQSRRRPVLKLRPQSLRVALFAVAAPLVLAATTVSALLVHIQQQNHPGPAGGQNQPAFHQSLVIASPSPTARTAVTSPTPVPSAAPVSSQAGVVPPPGSTASAPMTPSPTPTNPNLLPNQWFQNDTSGWLGWQAQIARVQVAGALGGGHAAVVTYSSGVDYSIYNNPPLTGTAGKTYTATVWVRAASPSALGGVVQLGLLERHGANLDANDVVDQRSPNVVLTNSFQPITVSITDLYGGDYVEVYAIRSCSCSAGDSFYAGGFSVTSS